MITKVIKPAIVILVYWVAGIIMMTDEVCHSDGKTEGRFHDGLDDAVNTAYLIEKLEMNPEYQLVSYEMPDKPSEHLCSTLGELFAGLDLKLA